MDFQDVYDEFQPRIRRFLSRLVGPDEAEDLTQYIDKLPPIYRSVFILSEYEDLTNPEIADALGISLHAVKTRLHRARQRLQIELRSRCHFSRDARNELVCEPKSPPVSVRR